jgi:hypothetical protein
VTIDQNRIFVIQDCCAASKGPVMPKRSGAERQDRADRILDTARELLLSWGYRVTIDELSPTSRCRKRHDLPALAVS